MLKTLKQKSKITQIALITIVSLFVIIMVAVVYSLSLLQAPEPNNRQLERFVVKKGEGVAAISSRLKERGFIKSDLLFKIYYRLNNDKYQIQAGSFELSPAMDVATILEVLGEGADDLWITLPEGMRREEIAQSLQQYALTVYDSDEFLTQTVALEGKLFPDTYLVPKEITTQALVVLMNSTFEKRIEPFREEIENSEYTLNEILTMASLLEREARDFEQMRLISGVLWKRLEMGMPLQVDATLQYAKGYNTDLGSWWVIPRQEDKNIDSSFNTYLNPGLPPKPVCNPGINAIEAALSPESSDYLFYIHDNQGRVHFGRNLEEHNQNIDQYLR